MATNLGKKFEAIVKEQWKKSFPGSFIYRLPDSQSGYTGVGGSNPCDFFSFIAEGICDNIRGQLFLLEVKSHEGRSIPFQAIRQYDKLITYVGLKDVHAGIIVWFIDYDIVVWVPIEEMQKMKSDGKKSINLKMLEEKSYNIIKLPSIKKRVFLDTDFTPLLNIDRGDINDN